MMQVIIDFILKYLSEIISGIIGVIIGSGITLRYIRNLQRQNNGDNSRNYQAGRDITIGRD